MHRVPLAVVFASLTQGCWFYGSCPTEEQEGRVSLDPTEVLAFLNDTSDTGSTEDPDLSALDCEEVCFAYFYDLQSCEEVSPDTGDVYAVRCTYIPECVGGRLHDAIRPVPTTPTQVDPIGEHLARMAHDEAASVVAFQLLEQELRTHGAPRHLRERVLEAAADEIRHARAIGTLARDRGAVVPQPVVEPLTARSLEEVARENVVEAVVLETWSALRAHVQAATATDPAFAAEMRTIAVEETRHAELARDLDAWFRSQLDDAANRRLDAARDEAFADLLLRSRTAMPEAIRGALGWPDPTTSLHLLQGLAAALWSGR